MAQSSGIIHVILRDIIIINIIILRAHTRL